MPPKRLILEHHFNNSLRILNFSCEVEQVFPKPTINIILNKSPLSYEEYLIESDEFEFNGLYDIILQLQEIEVNESTIITLGCEVEYPAPYDFKMFEEVEIELLEIVPPEEEEIGKSRVTLGKSSTPGHGKQHLAYTSFGRKHL